MYHILATFNGRLEPIIELPSLISCLNHIDAYWLDGEGHEYFAILHVPTKRIRAEVCRPPQSTPNYQAVRYPNGHVRTFTVERVPSPEGELCSTS